MRPISFHDEIKELLNMNYFAHSLCLKPFSVILFRSYCKSSHNIQTLSKLLDRESRRWASNISAVVLFVLFSFINNNNYGTCSSNRVNYKRQKGQSIGHSSLVKRRLQRKIGLVTIYENRVSFAVWWLANRQRYVQRKAKRNVWDQPCT